VGLLWVTWTKFLIHEQNAPEALGLPLKRNTHTGREQGNGANLAIVQLERYDERPYQDSAGS